MSIIIMFPLIINLVYDLLNVIISSSVYRPYSVALVNTEFLRV
jgi:hypothetical protein